MAYLKASEGGSWLPVVHCLRADMPLRGETVTLLESCGVKASDLLFSDDACFPELVSRLQGLVLVDHNRATGALAAAGDRVCEIVDHHDDLGDHGHVPPELRKIAFANGQALAGSCCTQVAEEFMATERGKTLLARDEGAAARALLGVILVDTVNLDPKVKKATPRDFAMVEALEALSPSIPRGALFERLDAAKYNKSFWSSLSVDQCLRYDYKCFEVKGKRLGIASVLCSLEELAAKDGWADGCNKFAERDHLCGVMAAFKTDTGEIRRQVIFFATDADHSAKAAAFAAKHTEPSLTLEALEINAGPALSGAKAFNQLNVAASRKQVAPMLMSFLENTLQ
eukprot:TRINITY_DN3038_c0_g1_i3.p1 TRINITY_DN3038_c0_g1~~TRINITY_DN3038_c0_g1_i3.p1  ORF type:complete len:400 (+),score=89.66 TRINITY_DN3038_c0_g1_i3:180-1202(+)